MQITVTYISCNCIHVGYMQTTLGLTKSVLSEAVKLKSLKTGNFCYFHTKIFKHYAHENSFVSTALIQT